MVSHRKPGSYLLDIAGVVLEFTVIPSQDIPGEVYCLNFNYEGTQGSRLSLTNIMSAADNVRQALLGIDQQCVYVKLKVETTPGQLIDLFGPIPLLVEAPPGARVKLYGVEVLHHPPNMCAAVTRLSRLHMIDTGSILSGFVCFKHFFL